MNKFTKFVKDFWQDEEGLTAVEYAVAGGIISILIVAAFKALGGSVAGVINGISAVLTANTPTP
ncbi:Flp family type IVb pilin [Vibrio fluvialis]|nr:Flp family type IVb pilin [Vibrio fluvialis]MBY7869708.1 Flp family type IVb pilin [Vibrio fluvialis]MBY8094099.1 Flp family type IVb pilin [Vibrio fluvialis]